MSYNAKNYTKQGGDETHFGGKVVFEQGCQVEGLAADPLQPATDEALGGVIVGDGLSVENDGTISVAPAADDALGGVIVGTGLEVEEDGTLSVTPTPDADTDTKGLVKQGAAVADAAGDAPTAAEFKALLDSLRNAGIIAVEE